MFGQDSKLTGQKGKCSSKALVQNDNMQVPDYLIGLTMRPENIINKIDYNELCMWILHLDSIVHVHVHVIHDISKPCKEFYIIYD